MDRLIFQNIDFNHKPLSAEQRVKARRAQGRRIPREASDYRGAKRNARSHVARCNPSTEGRRGEPVRWAGLNRSKRWMHADNYFDARDLSQSNRTVV